MYIILCFQDTNSFEWTRIHIESLKRLCIYHVRINLPIPENIRQLATAPLPLKWFNITVDANITDLISIITQPTITTPSITTEPPTAFTQDLLDKLMEIGCPYDCHGNGVCIKGV